MLGDAIAQNVHPFWQNTPAPTVRCSSCWPRASPRWSGSNLILGVILMRLVLMIGLLLLVLALPGLVRHLGGRLSVAMWLVVASPMTVIHLVGGPHNDLLMIGLLAMGVLLVLERKHTAGIGVVTLAWRSRRRPGSRCRSWCGSGRRGWRAPGAPVRPRGGGHDRHRSSVFGACMAAGTGRTSAGSARSTRRR